MVLCIMYIKPTCHVQFPVTADHKSMFADRERKTGKSFPSSGHCNNKAPVTVTPKQFINLLKLLYLLLNSKTKKKEGGVEKRFIFAILL